MKKDELLARLDLVIGLGAETIGSVAPSSGVLSRVHSNPDSGWVSPGYAGRYRAAGLAVLQTIFGIKHQHYVDFEAVTNDANVVRRYHQANGLLKTVRDIVDAGWLTEARALIAADIFANMLEMSEYLLSEGYKDPAAVLVGGSLEGHLRNLAANHSVPLIVAGKNGPKPVQAETLNQDLHKANAYTLGDQKQITAWLHLRNLAAHGKYTEFDAAQVRNFLDGVRTFILRVPA